MQPSDKSPQYLTSQELEEAIRRHREQTKKLLAEARSRRAKAKAESVESSPSSPDDKSPT